MVSNTEPGIRRRIFPSDDESVCVLAVGDICGSYMPASAMDTTVIGNVYSEAILRLLHQKDISLANLECPLTTIQAPISKSGPNIRSHPKLIDLLTVARFDIAILANNHIMDHGEQALQETMSVCEENGITTLGAGANAGDASQPAIREVGGLSVAFLAFAEEEFSCATATTPGACKYDLTTSVRAIGELKKQADLVIVNVHGGNILYPLPSPRMQEQYRLLVAAGADAVIGHHPHTVQGMEIYEQAPIIYSLGTFLFPPKARRPICWNQGLIVKLIISRRKIACVELYPCQQTIGEDAVSLDVLIDHEKDEFISRFEQLQSVISNQYLLDEYWKCFCISKKRQYLNDLREASAWVRGDVKTLVKRFLKTGNIQHLSAIFSDFVYQLCTSKANKRQAVNKLKNLLICPAHLDVLTTAVEMERLGTTPEENIWRDYRALMGYCT